MMLRRAGFTMLELLVIVGIVGILVGIGTPLYVDWRANTLNREAVRTVETAIAASRVEAKRQDTTLSIRFTNDATSFVERGITRTLPNGGRLSVTSGPLDLSFSPPFGSQSPSSVVSIGVTTGTGPFARTSTISVIPPLGHTAVAR